MRLHARAILLMILSAAVLGGCGLFSTRSAEEPEAGRGSWETPRVPGDVLVNMANALFERNSVNYLRSFNADDFTFEADDISLADDPSLSPWHYVDETSHINSLMNEGTLPRDSLLFVLFISPEGTIIQDSAEIHTPYQLTAAVAIAGAPRTRVGTAHFYLRLGREGYWEIYRWTDARTEEGSTWSELKSAVR